MPHQSLTERAPVLRRIMAAWVYDYIICLWLATAILFGVRLVTGLAASSLMHVQFLTFVIYVFRDTLTGKSCSVGKLLTGIRLVKTKGSGPPGVWQNALRNLVLLGPYFVFQIVTTLWQTAHSTPSDTSAALQFFKTTCITLTSILLVLEYYLMLKNDGRRLADKLAYTKVILADKRANSLSAAQDSSCTEPNQE